MASAPKPARAIKRLSAIREARSLRYRAPGAWQPGSSRAHTARQPGMLRGREIDLLEPRSGEFFRMPRPFRPAPVDDVRALHQKTAQRGDEGPRERGRYERDGKAHDVRRVHGKFSDATHMGAEASLKACEIAPKRALGCAMRGASHDVPILWSTPQPASLYM
jgi:hypothetical protein